jgi:hypothetical protein
MAFASPSRNQIFLVSVASQTKLRQKIGFGHREERAGDSVFSFSLSENRLGGKSTCRFCEIRHQKASASNVALPKKSPKKTELFALILVLNGYAISGLRFG